MNIGIFSKIGANGGSEHRCAEMANAVVKYTEHQCTLLCEKELNEIIKNKLDPRVKVVLNVFKPADIANPDAIYGFDVLVVINTDSYSFAQAAYWEGTLCRKGEDKPKHHAFKIDLKKIPRMVFLFNFIISPSQWLVSIAKKCKDVRMIVANRDFDYQVQYKDKLKKVKKLPRMVLESPIDPEQVVPEKTKSDKIRIGKHSKAHGYKHNSECGDLIKKVNDQYGDRIAWDFLGVPKNYIPDISDISNVVVRPEYSIPVRDYLMGIDIFLFFISWSRHEPWARAVAEAMRAGCPILATNKAGNKDQVMDGLNGFLCESVDQFIDRIGFLINHPEIMTRMRHNNILMAEQFTPEKVVQKFIRFIGD